MIKKFLVFIFAVFFAINCLAQTVRFEISASPETISANTEFTLIANFSIPDGTHIYGKNVSAEIGSPTKISLNLPKGFSVISEIWSTPQKLKEFGIEYEGYKKSATVKFIIKSPSKINESVVKTITANADWLLCGKFCVPQSAKAKVDINLIANKEYNISNVLIIIFGAFLGGLILNLMPCVFPVLGLKIMSFASSASKGRKENLIGAILYASGIIVTFLTLGIILISLKNLGGELGWGFQLQNPYFTGAMALFFFAMSLSFLGVYEIGAGFAGGMTSAEESSNSILKKHLSSIASGVLAVLVASPCTAPFMGASLGYALTSEASTWEIFLIFFALGLGMAFPYLLLSAIPAFSKILPRPGNWLLIMQKILAIPLLVTVLWLLWIYENQTGKIFSISLSMLILLIGLVCYGKMTMPHKDKTIRVLGRIQLLFAILLTTLLLVFPFGIKSDSVNVQKNEEVKWSQEKVKDLLAKGFPVYIDFTADWCLTCAYNKTILNSEEISKLMREKNVKILIGDWTNKNPNIAKELEKFGRAGVPLNLLYIPSDKDNPIVLPAILTKSILIEAVDKIK